MDLGPKARAQIREHAALGGVLPPITGELLLECPQVVGHFRRVPTARVFE